MSILMHADLHHPLAHAVRWTAWLLAGCAGRLFRLAQGLEQWPMRRAARLRPGADEAAWVSERMLRYGKLD